MKTAITPTRAENYPEWYQQLVRAADLAETSPVRGCMVIKPWGYALWENMQRVLDDMFKATGHVNAYFPLFIPKSFLEKEAEHVEGFAKECAVVTHHRLIEGPEGGLIPDPEAKLEEPLIVRPTSETIIGAAYANWVQSYRDLPILINQWANVVRWELRTRLFLRTSEFLWQEGHTAHATEAEAREETLRMLEVYRDFAENWMAIPVITGEKSEGEKFPGAVNTYTFEPMMQDRRALQAGTSHFLGQNFAKAQDIEFLDADGERKYAWTTSWGVSTRLIGGLIMAHSDDNGLVLPPRLAPTHIVILPITHKADDPQAIIDYCNALAAELREKRLGERRLNVHVDTRDIRGGDKSWEWIKKGVPVRLEVGPRDFADRAVFMGRRDQGPREKSSVPRDQFVSEAVSILEQMQQALYDKARQFRDEHTRLIDTREDFYAFFTPENREQPEIHGGFAYTHWSRDEAAAAQIQKELGVTVRCIPFHDVDGPGTCPFTNQPSPSRVLWAKAY